MENCTGVILSVVLFRTTLVSPEVYGVFSLNIVISDSYLKTGLNQEILLRFTVEQTC